MRHLAFGLVLGSALGTWSCHASKAPPPPTKDVPAPADIVLANGDVVTMDPAHPHARALALSGGKIVYVGDDASRWIGPRTRVIDLAGRSAVASLTDAHAHLAGLGEALDQVALDGCKSPADCAARLRSKPASKGQEWIRGRGWDQNRFADGTFPTHDALDHVVGDRPVWLERVDGHAGWANARALRLAGIDRNTADPPGGRIVRDAAGDATGVLVDNAMALVDDVIPPPTAAERERAILRAQDVALSHGITEVHEMGIDDTTVAVYRQLARAGRLHVRVYAFHSARGLDATLQSKPDPPEPYAMFRLHGIKFFADGALGSRGAALLGPYSDEPKNEGLLLTAPETLEPAIRRALAAGWQPAVHAIGDRANRIVLDAFERAGCAQGDGAARCRIEHAQILDRADIPRFRALGVIASMQPTHATSDMPWAEARLGKERLFGAYAWKRLLEAGAHVAWGSDFPVEDVSLVAGLRAAVTRADGAGRPRGGWLPDQRLSLDEALRGFSAGAAFAAFEESWRGRAAPGQAADVTVFDRHLEPGGDTPFDARVDLTIVGGSVVFSRSTSS